MEDSYSIYTDGEKQPITDCPFCGSSDVEITALSLFSYFYVRCFSCGSHGPSGESEETAVNKWNCRAVNGQRK